MLEVSFETTNLTDLDVKMRRAISRKMTELTILLYEKVQENLAGKILQTKSGQLLSSVEYERERMTEGVITGSVFINPETPKAFALEFGGKGNYPIVPTKSSVLRFISKGGATVFASSVDHPPSRKFGYLQHALEEIELRIPERFSDLIWLIEAGEGED